MESVDLEKLERKVVRIARNVLPYSHFFFFHYTFHDIRHCESMKKYLEGTSRDPGSLIGSLSVPLNKSEYHVLKMAIYLHDIGMALNPRFWDKLQLSRSEISRWVQKWGIDDPIEKLEKNQNVTSMLEKWNEKSLEKVLFEGQTLVFPNALKSKPWDNMGLYERRGLRELIRGLHPWLSANYSYWNVLKDREDVRDAVATIVKSHDLENDDVEKIRVPDFESIVINGRGVDLRKLSGLLILLDSLDCTAVGRGDYNALKNIATDVKMMSYEHLCHWLFKFPIKKVEIKSNEILLKCNTRRPEKVAGIMFFELGKVIYPYYTLARRILEGISIPEIYVEFPGGPKILVMDEVVNVRRKLPEIEREELENIGIDKERLEKIKPYRCDDSFPFFEAIAIMIDEEKYAAAEELIRRELCDKIESMKGLEKLLKCY